MDTLKLDNELNGLRLHDVWGDLHVTSPILGPPLPCKQALNQYGLRGCYFSDSLSEPAVLCLRSWKKCKWACVLFLSQMTLRGLKASSCFFSVLYYRNLETNSGVYIENNLQEFCQHAFGLLLVHPRFLSRYIFLRVICAFSSPLPKLVPSEDVSFKLSFMLWIPFQCSFSWMDLVELLSWAVPTIGVCPCS